MTKAQKLGITKFPYEEFDSNGHRIYCEVLNGDWDKQEYDSNGNEIYFESRRFRWKIKILKQINK